MMEIDVGPHLDRAAHWPRDPEDLFGFLNSETGMLCAYPFIHSWLCRVLLWQSSPAVGHRPG